MIAPAAIAAALAFWAPANGGAPPCPAEWQPHMVEHASDVEPADFGEQVGFSTIGGGCDRIWIRNDVSDAALSAQCALIVHEIGHAVFGLQHTDQPGDVMNGSVLVTPPACSALDPPPVPDVPNPPLIKPFVMPPTPTPSAARLLAQRRGGAPCVLAQSDGRTRTYRCRRGHVVVTMGLTAMSSRLVPVSRPR